MARKKGELTPILEKDYISGFCFTVEPASCYYFNSFYDKIENKYVIINKINIRHIRDLNFVEKKREQETNIRLSIERIQRSKKETHEISLNEISDILNQKDIKTHVVSNNFCTEYLGLVRHDNHKNFNYTIFYILKINEEKYYGVKMSLTPQLNDRNDLVLNFNSRITDLLGRHKIKYGIDYGKTTNTLQELQKDLFLEFGYLIYGEEDYKGERRFQKPSYVTEGQHDLIYLPKIGEKFSSFVSKDVTYVYIIYNKRNGYYKIGRSIRPGYREKTLQSEDPDIVLVKKWVAEHSVEKRLHKIYKEKRVRGEWFKLSETDVVEIELYMKKLINKEE